MARERSRMGRDTAMAQAKSPHRSGLFTVKATLGG